MASQARTSRKRKTTDADDAKKSNAHTSSSSRLYMPSLSVDTHCKSRHAEGAPASYLAVAHCDEDCKGTCQDKHRLKVTRGAPVISMLAKARGVGYEHLCNAIGDMYGAEKDQALFAFTMLNAGADDDAEAFAAKAPPLRINPLLAPGELVHKFPSSPTPLAWRCEGRWGSHPWSVFGTIDDAWAAILRRLYNNRYTDGDGTWSRVIIPFEQFAREMRDVSLPDTCQYRDVLRGCRIAMPGTAPQYAPLYVHFSELKCLMEVESGDAKKTNTSEVRERDAKKAKTDTSTTAKAAGKSKAIDMGDDDDDDHDGGSIRSIARRCKTNSAPVPSKSQPIGRALKRRVSSEEVRKVANEEYKDAPMGFVEWIWKSVFAPSTVYVPHGSSAKHATATIKAKIAQLGSDPVGMYRRQRRGKIAKLRPKMPAKLDADTKEWEACHRFLVYVLDRLSGAIYLNGGDDDTDGVREIAKAWVAYADKAGFANINHPLASRWTNREKQLEIPTEAKNWTEKCFHAINKLVTWMFADAHWAVYATSDICKGDDKHKHIDWFGGDLDVLQALASGFAEDLEANSYSECVGVATKLTRAQKVCLQQQGRDWFTYDEYDTDMQGSDDDDDDDDDDPIVALD